MKLIPRYGEMVVAAVPDPVEFVPVIPVVAVAVGKGVPPIPKLLDPPPEKLFVPLPT